MARQAIRPGGAFPAFVCETSVREAILKGGYLGENALVSPAAGSAAGVGAASGVGAALARAAGSAAGAATAAGVGASTGAGTASAAGSAGAGAVGAAIARATGSASGSAAAAAVGAQATSGPVVFDAVGTSASFTADFIGQGDWTSLNNALMAGALQALAVNGAQGLAVRIGDGWVGRTASFTVNF